MFQKARPYTFIFNNDVWMLWFGYIVVKGIFNDSKSFFHKISIQADFVRAMCNVFASTCCYLEIKFTLRSEDVPYKGEKK